MSSSYYSQKLAADKLRQVYTTAPPRIQQYLAAEIEFVASHIKPGDHVLELGCGYGRVLKALSGAGKLLMGVDTSLISLQLAREELQDTPDLHLVAADAANLALADSAFDVVACIQNGISAFHVDQATLVREAARVTCPGGTVLFSSYSESFWNERLNWFENQAELGLIGSIDYDRTGDGTIFCIDGFTATTVSEAQFRQLAAGVGVDFEVTEVDGSSLFCVIRK